MATPDLASPCSAAEAAQPSAVVESVAAYFGSVETLFAALGFQVFRQMFGLVVSLGVLAFLAYYHLSTSHCQNIHIFLARRIRVKQKEARRSKHSRGDKTGVIPLSSGLCKSPNVSVGERLRFVPRGLRSSGRDEEGLALAIESSVVHQL